MMNDSTHKFTITVRGQIPDNISIEDRLHYGGCEDADIFFDDNHTVRLTFDREYPSYQDATEEALDQVEESFSDVLDSFVTVQLEGDY